MASSEKVTIQLSGGGPWGFRLQGGSGSPLTVSKIRRRSRAHNQLREKDQIISINGIPCESQSHDQAMSLVDEAGDVLFIDILRSQAGKENIAPQIPSTKDEHRISSTTTETRSMVENSTKIFEQQKQQVEDLRLQSNIHHTNETQTTTREMQPVNPGAVILQPQPDPPFTFPTIPKLHLFAPSPLTLPNATDLPAFLKEANSSSLIQDLKLADSVGGGTPGGQREFEVQTEAGPNSFRQVTTERTKDKQANSESSSFRQEERSYSKQELPAGPLVGSTSTSTTSESSSLFKVTKFEAKQSTNSESRSTWRPTSPVFDQPIEPPQIIKPLAQVPLNYQTPEKKVGPPVAPKPRPVSAPPPLDFSVVPPPLDFGLKNSFQRKETISSTHVSKTSEFNHLLEHSADHQASNPYMPSPEIEDDDMGSSSLLSRRRKTFSSSSFYEEPHAIYPTVEEQVELCRKIADSLSDDTNVKSKGANMFYKRVKRSHKWIHEGPDPYLSDGGTTDTEFEPQTPDPAALAKAPYIRVSKGPPKLKLILDPREILDMQKLRNSGIIINEHNAVSPDICLDLVRDLNSPSGRGAALFAKRKQKAEEWVVDEERVRAKTSQLQKMAESLAQSEEDKLSGYVQNPRLKLIKSPWEAALESPIGSCDGAFVEISPVYGSSYMTRSIIQAAENKINRALSPVAGQQHQPPSSGPAYAPVAPINIDIYRPKAPRGWMGTNLDSVPVGRVEDGVTSREAPAPLSQDSGSLPRASRAAPRPLSFHDFNSIPKTWSSSQSGSSGFRPVKPPRFS